MIGPPVTWDAPADPAPSKARRDWSWIPDACVAAVVIGIVLLLLAVAFGVAFGAARGQMCGT
jgi:hypothetical protein